MNIAFTTLAILLLLLPGIFFSRFYYAGEFSKQYFKPTFFELILSTLIQSTILHVFWIWLCTKWGYEFDYATIFSVMSGLEDSEHLTAVAASFESNIGNILRYNFSLWAGSIVLGRLLRFIVRKLKLDRRYHLLRFQNEWHYILTGEMLDFPGVKGKAKKVEAINVDVLVNGPEGGIIYSGLLQNYILSKNGGLELLNLTKVERRFLRSDNPSSSEQAPYFKLKGEVFAIPYSAIQNIHILYIDVEIKADGEEKTQNTGEAE